MSDRSDLPKIKPEGQPTFFNREAAGWGLLSSIIGSVVGMRVPGAPAAKIGVDLAITAAGTTFGGLQGMARQQREATEGRTVKDPSYWNSGILGGWLISGIAMSPFLYHTHYSGNAISPMLATITTIGTLGCMAVGSVMRKNAMQHDFDKAVELQNQEKARTAELLQTIAMERGHGAGVNHPVSYKNSVTAEEAATLAEKQEHHAHSHTAHAHQQQSSHATARTTGSMSI